MASLRRLSQQPLPPPRRMSILAAADYLGVSEGSIRRYIADGILAAERIGPRCIRIRIEALDALVEPVVPLAARDAADR